MEWKWEKMEAFICKLFLTVIDDIIVVSEVDLYPFAWLLNILLMGLKT